MVCLDYERPLVFSKDAMIVDIKDFDMHKPIKVIKESTQSQSYNKFMIVKDNDQMISIIECKERSFAQYMEKFDLKFIRQILKR